MARLLSIVIFAFVFLNPHANAQSTGRVCYNKKTGKISSVGGRCPSGSSELTTSAIKKFTTTLGLKGPTGEKGAKGDQGDKGPTGDQGAAGVGAFDIVPSGRSIFGVIGGVLTGPVSSAGDEAKWSTVGSITGILPHSLSDTDVIVAYNPVFSNCALTAPNRNRFPCLNASDLSQASRCTGSVDSPTAPPGKLCIYTSSMNNAYDVQGIAARNGRTGFDVQWKSVPSESPVTEFKAVWGYTAP